MQTLNPAVSHLLPDLDRLDELEALELIAEVREWAHRAFEEQTLRARVRGRSWRAIAAASGVNSSTTRRWARAGSPDSPRRRL